MKIVVASPISAGSQKAHAINTVKHANGFAKLGNEVIIIFYKGEITGSANLNQFYSLDKSIKWLLVPNKIFGKTLGLHHHFTWLALPLLYWLNPHFIYTRAYHLPNIASKLGFKVVAESHAHLDNSQLPFLNFIKSTLNSTFLKWITISSFLKEGYIKLGAVGTKIQVLPDAVDLSIFRHKNDINSVFPKTKAKKVVYTGHLYDYKGIPLILQAAEKLPEIEFHLIGGLAEDIDRHKSFCLKHKIVNVYFHGLKIHNQVPPYLWSADLLLLTHTLNHPSARWTSPVKLAEYLASNCPVLVADIPALQDWLTNEEVYFYIPDNLNSLINQILSILNENESQIKAKTENAMKLAENWTYEKRCSKILEGII